MVEIISVCLESPDSSVIRQAAKALLDGEIVAIPTDTIYGLCARTHDANAIKKLYVVKGRHDGKKGAPTLIGDISQLSLLAAKIPPVSQLLMDTFWPGPLTLVLPAMPDLSPLLLERNGIAIRYPAHSVCQAVARICGPFVATSANYHDQSPLNDAEIISKKMGEKIRLILDGGPIMNQLPSTVVDTKENSVQLVREGAISYLEIEKVLKKNNI